MDTASMNTLPRLNSKFSNESLKKSPRSWLQNLSLSPPSFNSHLKSPPFIKTTREMASYFSSEDAQEVIQTSHITQFASNIRDRDRPSSEPQPSGSFQRQKRDSDNSAVSEPSYPLNLNALRQIRTLHQNPPPRSSSRQAISSDTATNSLRQLKSKKKLVSAFSMSTSCSSKSPSSAPTSFHSGHSEEAKALTKELPPPLKLFARSHGECSVLVPEEDLALSPFRAILLGKAEAYPKWLSEDAKLVTLNVGGQIFTTSLQNMCSKPSRLAEWVKHIVEETRIRANLDILEMEGEIARDELVDPMLSQQIITESPLQVQTDHLQEQEQITFGSLTSLSDSIDLETPKISHRAEQKPMLVEYGFPLAQSAKASVCTFPQTVIENEDEEAQSVEGWTSHASSRSSSFKPLPSIPSSRQSENIADILLQHHLKAIASPATPSNPLKSLESRQTSYYAKSASGSEIDYSMKENYPEGRRTNEAVEVFLDRSPDSYPSILHWLRFGRLPRTLLLSCPLPGDALSLLIFRPTLIALQDLQEEARWLGLTSLVEECTSHLSETKTLPKRTDSQASLLQTAKPEQFSKKQANWI